MHTIEGVQEGRCGLIREMSRVSSIGVPNGDDDNDDDGMVLL